MKDKLTGDNGGKLDGHVSDEEYLTCNKIWNKFNMKNMGDCHDIDIYLIIEKWLRRGISYICKRYSEVNNNYMKLCNPTKSSKLIGTLIWIIYVAGEWVSFLLMGDLSGWKCR